MVQIDLIKSNAKLTKLSSYFVKIILSLPYYNIILKK